MPTSGLETSPRPKHLHKGRWPLPGCADPGFDCPIETTTSTLIALSEVEKVFRSGHLEHWALRGVDLTLRSGDMNVIVGPSGSGKSTILNMITGIDRPTTGTVTVGGKDLGAMTEEELAVWRGETVGIVFQFFQLIPTLTALENAILPMEFGPRERRADRGVRATRNLERVGLGDKLGHLPLELSGGEQQRVAIARALARDPEILIADEPTGNLDTETARSVLALLRNLSEAGTTIVLATHDSELAAQADRIVSVRDGRVVEAG